MTDFVNIGIHLGLSNCSVAKYDQFLNDDSQFFCFESGSKTIPSYVSFAQLPEQLHIGEPAENDIEKEYVVYDSLKFIGKKFEDIDEREDELEKYPFQIREKDEYIQLGVSNPLIDDEDEWFYPEEIVGYLLKKRLIPKYGIAFMK